MVHRRTKRALSALVAASALLASGCADGADDSASPGSTTVDGSAGTSSTSTPAPDDAPAASEPTTGVPTSSRGSTSGTVTPDTVTSPSTTSTTAVEPTTTTPTTAVEPTTTTTEPPTTTTTAPPPAALEPGDDGPEVEALQSRLERLHYWVGPVDGVYGPLTSQAVMAFEKVHGLPPDGIADAAVRVALGDPAEVTPSRPERDYAEVDLDRRVLLIVRDGAVRSIFNTSTGTFEQYQHPTLGVQLADTPPGRHTVDWQIDGVSDGELGPLYRPKYFHRDGIAIHGYSRVPAQAASHGCVRVTYAAMDAIWDDDLVPLRSTVIVTGQPPAPRGP